MANNASKTTDKMARNISYYHLRDSNPGSLIKQVIGVSKGYCISNAIVLSNQRAL